MERGDWKEYNGQAKGLGGGGWFNKLHINK